MMSGIRGRDTSPERIVRRYLHRAGFRFRLHVRDLPGCPDIVLPKYGTVVFVHGCFWHQHSGCRYAYMPKSNREFWRTKLSGNRDRDLRHARELEILGWQVIVVWECQTRQQRELEHVVELLDESRL
jgi:DNA mismatch endonuclease, patch repair protein